MARNNSEAQKRADQKYKAKVKRLYLEFYPTEAEMLEHIEKQPQKATYIKNLIREDMAKEQS